MSPTTVAYLTSTHANPNPNPNHHHNPLYSSGDYSERFIKTRPEMGAIRVGRHDSYSHPNHHYETPGAGNNLVLNTNNNNNDKNKYNDDGVMVVMVENPHWTRTKENALKLILLLLSIVFYIFTWNNNLVLQQWIMTTMAIATAEPVKVYNHHHITDDGSIIGFCCSNPNVTTTMVPSMFDGLPSQPVQSLPSSQSVVQSLMKRNSLICFLMILIVVTVICEKLFSSHQTSIIISVDGGHHHNHHHYIPSGLYNRINKNHNDDNDEMPKMETTIKDYSNSDNRSLPNIRPDLLIRLARLLPLRFMSKVWGQANRIPLPRVLRRPIYGGYARLFDCNLDEMENKDLRQYRNLGEFFRRPLAAENRPISQENGVVSPADGLLIQSDTVPEHGGWIRNIKGINYKIDHFLGNNCFDDSFQQDWSVNVGKIRPGHRLYATAVYLAPGDYHRFHSPTDWTIKHRRHFSGSLFSVNPLFANMIPDLFSINERVVYFGEWKYGFFSMAAVGAYNVGTINVFSDQDLRTNQTLPKREYCWEKTFNPGVTMEKGELFGEFNLGSTMVMIYEAPVGHSDWGTWLNEKVKYGELLLRIDDDDDDDDRRLID